MIATISSIFAACVRKHSIPSISTRLVNFCAPVSSDHNALSDSLYHTPILLKECCEYLQIKPGGLYVDCTLGGGGHTKVILEKGGKVIGLDQDIDAIKHSTNRLQNYIENGQLEIFQTNFRRINEVITRSSMLWETHEQGAGVDGVLMDLGISSHQIDIKDRGFSFMGEGAPLDMRMNKDGSSLTAADIVNTYELHEIADILYNFGDESRSRQIAREIVGARPINSTQHLADVIIRVTAWKHRPQTLSRCFQALRIVVNDEINSLEETLGGIHRIVRPHGRLAIISYHSLEDRRVKNLFRYGNAQGHTDEATLALTQGNMYSNSKFNTIWNPILKKAMAPSTEEVESNSRSRSAKLRVAERVSDADIANFVNKTPAKSKIGSKQLAKLEKKNDVS